MCAAPPFKNLIMTGSYSVFKQSLWHDQCTIGQRLYGNQATEAVTTLLPCGPTQAIVAADLKHQSQYSSSSAEDLLFVDSFCSSNKTKCNFPLLRVATKYVIIAVQYRTSSIFSASHNTTLQALVLLCQKELMRQHPPKN